MLATREELDCGLARNHGVLGVGLRKHSPIIIGYLELEGTHKEHQIQLNSVRQDPKPEGSTEDSAGAAVTAALGHESSITQPEITSHITLMGTGKQRAPALRAQKGTSTSCELCMEFCMEWFCLNPFSMVVFAYSGIYALKNKGCARDASPLDSATEQLWF